jgi:hypothetical protein
MKFICIFLLLFLTALQSFCQDYDLVQQPEIYKNNKVRLRVMMYNYNRLSTKVFDSFDKNGWHTERVNTDSTGKIPLIRNKYIYDSLGNIISQITITYSKVDSNGLQQIQKMKPDTSVANFITDPLAKTITVILNDSVGKIKYKEVFTLDKLKGKMIWYNKDGSYTESVIEFDKPYIEKSIYTTTTFTNGTKEAGSTFFKNKFDKEGNIISRKVKKQLTPSEESHQAVFFKNISYRYLRNGLLANRISSEANVNADWMWGVIFDYKYYE